MTIVSSNCWMVPGFSVHYLASKTSTCAGIAQPGCRHFAPTREAKTYSAFFRVDMRVESEIGKGSTFHVLLTCLTLGRASLVRALTTKRRFRAPDD